MLAGDTGFQSNLTVVVLGLAKKPVGISGTVNGMVSIDKGILSLNVFALLTFDTFLVTTLILMSLVSKLIKFIKSCVYLPVTLSKEGVISE